MPISSNSKHMRVNRFIMDRYWVSLGIRAKLKSPKFISKSVVEERKKEKDIYGQAP
jgi:hypothetical protein